MNRIPLAPLLLRRACVRVVAYVIGGPVGRLLRPGSYLQRWMRRRVRAGIYVKVAPFEGAIVRERKFFTTNWTAACGLNLRRVG